MAIKSFKHKGLQKFYETESTAGIQSSHANKIRSRLAALDDARTPRDMFLPGFNCHELHGDLAGHYSVRVSGNWRITYTFDEDGDAIIVNYQDYH